MLVLTILINKLVYYRSNFVTILQFLRTLTVQTEAEIYLFICCNSGRCHLSFEFWKNFYTFIQLEVIIHVQLPTTSVTGWWNSINVFPINDLPVAILSTISAQFFLNETFYLEIIIKLCSTYKIIETNLQLTI